jgi:hypothetical protein
MTLYILETIARLTEIQHKLKYIQQVCLSKTRNSVYYSNEYEKAFRIKNRKIKQRKTARAVRP